MIYSGTIEAKTGHKIPAYSSGKIAHSKYNPTADKVALGENTYGCVLVFGIAAGFHIKNLMSNKNIQKIIAVEADKESLEFCRNLETVKELAADGRITLCSLEDFSLCLCSSYLPSLHKKLTTVFLRSWHDELPDADTKIKKLIDLSIESISADFSVQAHFGKHWHRNILANLKFIGETNFQNPPVSIPAEKTRAAIIAAGPTLDNSLETLKEQRANTYIISTDTAYGTLIGNGIEPDAVVSVDAQQVSSEHFLGMTKSNGLFIFDIASNPKTILMTKEIGNQIFFIRSNHPLASLASERIYIPLTESGSGTVTIAAADWARQQGFKEIQFFGADFAYSDGKPYCRGTYLEKKFNSKSCRVSSSENLYSTLMFRTELTKTDKGLLGNLGKSPVTSKVLSSYGSTLLEWASKYGMTQEGNLFKTCETVKDKSPCKGGSFDYNDFIRGYTGKLKALADKMDTLPLSELTEEILNSRELISLLPLFAAIGKDTLIEDISIALQLLLYYNL